MEIIFCFVFFKGVLVTFSHNGGQILKNPTQNWISTKPKKQPTFGIFSHDNEMMKNILFLYALVDLLLMEQSSPLPLFPPNLRKQVQ